MIPASEREKTVDVLDRSVTLTGTYIFTSKIFVFTSCFLELSREIPEEEFVYDQNEAR
jgi:hypothetical protein